MAIVSEHIEINITRRNVAHYRQLGYNVEALAHGISNKLTVPISHLPGTSRYKIKIQCPECNRERDVLHINLVKQKSHICTKCFAKIQGKKNNGTNNGQYGKRGKESPQYKHGRTMVEELIRKSVQYKEWRISVYERDGYTCKKCGKRSGRLHSHHVQSFNEVVMVNNINVDNWRLHYDTLFDTANGLTLCINCHKEYHVLNGGYKKESNQYEIDKWLKTITE